LKFITFVLALVALLAYLPAAGSTEGLDQVKSPADWPAARAKMLDGMQQVMGPLPDRSHLPPLDVKVLNRSKADGIETLSLSIFAEKIGDRDDRIPALLLIPDHAPGAKLPAMLALHPTSNLGKREITGQGHMPYDPYAIELARRGYVVICPDYPSFGDYAHFDFKAAFASGRYASGTMKGIFNHMRCVDVLQSRDDVDPDRIGVIGHSLGGHNAMFVGAFDTRLKVIVSSCGWTPFADYYAGNLKGWTQDRYMPRVRDAYGSDPQRMPFDFDGVIACLAPRPFFSNSPLHDANFDVAGVRKGIASAKRIYELLGAADHLQVRHPDAEHSFPKEVREEAYAFVDRVLKH
jgi:dienelactone hydrolase